jgi:hypothetical protein
VQSGSPDTIPDAELCTSHRTWQCHGSVHAQRLVQIRFGSMTRSQALHVRSVAIPLLILNFTTSVPCSCMPGEMSNTQSLCWRTFIGKGFQPQTGTCCTSQMRASYVSGQSDAMAIVYSDQVCQNPAGVAYSLSTSTHNAYNALTQEVHLQQCGGWHDTIRNHLERMVYPG